MLALPSPSTCFTFCIKRFNFPVFFHHSVSKVGSQDPTSLCVKSETFHFDFFKFLSSTTETLLPRSSSLKIISPLGFEAEICIITCGREIGIRFVPAPLKEKAV